MNDDHKTLGFKDICAGLTPRADENGGNRYSGDIPATWMQGRTAYGGLTCGLALAAAQKAFCDLPPLRSMQCGFIGPIGPNPVITPTLMRQGRNVTSISVDVQSDDKLCARILFYFGARRDSLLSETLRAPKAGHPEETEDYTPPAYRAMVPVFFLQFENRLIAGHRPLSGADDGYIRTWSRHLDTNSRDGMASFLTVGDVLPPAAMPTFKQFGPVSSINWQLNIMKPELATRDGWWHIENRLTAGQDGYSTQIMRYWNTEGELVAEGTQLVAIFM